MDEPSAEPLEDLAAQVEHLHAGGRRGVYLSRANLATHAQKDVEKLAKGLTRMPNYDGKGGLLLVRPDGVSHAKELRQTMPREQALGQLTGAGGGKDPRMTHVVQGRTPAGAVAIEGAVSPENLGAAVQAVSRTHTPVVGTPKDAIARRQLLLAQALRQ